MKTFINILTKPFKLIWDNILEPQLELALRMIIEMLINLFQTIIQPILYEIAQVCLNFIRLLERLLRYLLGVNTAVRANGQQLTFLDALFKETRILEVFGACALISLLLTFIFMIRRLFTIVANDENERAPFSKMFGSLLKCWYRIGISIFICTILLGFFRIGAITIVYKCGAGKASIANTLFAVFSYSQLKSNSDSERTAIIRRFMDADDTYCSYDNESAVKKYFNKDKINYLGIIFVTLIFLAEFVNMAYRLSRRLFNLAILFVIGPFFASWSLIDENSKYYEGWQGMFLANFMNALFPLVGFFIFDIIVDYIIATNYKFYADNTIINSIIVVFIVFCLLKSIPDSMKFGYNLFTDRGRFLSTGDLSLRDILSVTKLLGLES